MKDVCKLFLFAFAGALLAMPVIGPVGLLGVALAAWYLFKNSDRLLPPHRFSAVAAWLKRPGKRPKCRRANAKN